MRFEKLEKKINKLDNDIESLRRAKQYLSNIDEINEVMDVLNQERQVYADELYFEDSKVYFVLMEKIRGLICRELGRDEQTNLLEEIKEMHGRKSPNVSKRSVGLNAWLKFLDIECNWIDNPNSDWATLVITGYTPKINN